MEDVGLFPELMWQCLQIRPLVLAFRGLQGGEPQAAWMLSHGEMSNAKRKQMYGGFREQWGGQACPWDRRGWEVWEKRVYV